METENKQARQQSEPIQKRIATLQATHAEVSADLLKDNSAEIKAWLRNKRNTMEVEIEELNKKLTQIRSTRKRFLD